jgi:hypothetical protein
MTIFSAAAAAALERLDDGLQPGVYRNRVHGENERVIRPGYHRQDSGQTRPR